MDQGAVDSPVTLVIKAPNQKYDDQTINCFLNWTVEKLKAHLSNVYPSKPSSKDQRLVYSGRLLLDHLQLRDVLRKQDEYHMVHLVCASRSPPGSPRPHGSVRTHVTSDPEPSSSDSTDSSSSAPPSPDSQPASTAESSDGLRHRGGHTHHPTSPGFMQGHLGNQLPLQGGMPAGFPAYPMYNPMQVLWWQQMYARHYYMQYQAALASSSTPSPTLPSAHFPPPSPSPSHQQPPLPNEPPPGGPNPAPAPAQEEHPVNANIQMNAQGGAVLNEDELNRDWLDWMYTVSRAAILLSIVYFYSSFSRFIMVIGAMLLVYLHQAGWFPFRADLQNPGGGEGNPDDLDADRRNDMQEMERIMDEGLEDDDGDSGEDGPGDNAAANYPGFLASTWSFITTFFTSLIPEGPPQPPN
ncbi:homocysteine-responsive endoplasmic reticulum-resident ubiquitin-like domain member 2 protein [Megalops cyprinoides]|uniref:homocysteine-responsive endoplasmic reticulum-resident ubiquitin-like domain member 2 protein n=1 Tax=Megalops cyprinoides TaxID=118141 RepID=UPI0018646D55|nr:homocysteine-responsive endoplasmic reticulum-resident ubiquitin-like domain member 2 protein [Megalops cyprinoides]